MTTFKGSLGYSSQTKRDKLISQYTDVQKDEMVKIFMGNKRGCLSQPLPVSVYTSVCVQSSQALQLSRPRPFYANGVTGQCGGEGLERGAGVSIKNPPSISTSLPPSVAVARRAVITLVSALPGATPPPARGGGHP